jgi:hypothetical protein
MKTKMTTYRIETEVDPDPWSLDNLLDFLNPEVREVLQLLETRDPAIAQKLKRGLRHQVGEGVQGLHRLFPSIHVHDLGHKRVCMISGELPELRTLFAGFPRGESNTDTPYTLDPSCEDDLPY